jgi:hypothetical protein
MNALRQEDERSNNRTEEKPRGDKQTCSNFHFDRLSDRKSQRRRTKGSKTADLVVDVNVANIVGLKEKRRARRREERKRKGAEEREEGR